MAAINNPFVFMSEKWKQPKRLKHQGRKEDRLSIIVNNALNRANMISQRLAFDKNIFCSVCRPVSVSFVKNKIIACYPNTRAMSALIFFSVDQ
jgi:hypothetical protein